MNILSIETSCDETAAAVVKDGRTVLSDIVYSQAQLHRLYGGVVPEIASRKHIEHIDEVVNEAVKAAELTFSDIDAVAVTYAPGLIGALLVGVGFAKGLSYSLKVPLIPVHHLRSHIAANYITSPELEPPFICLVVSGGHSHIVEVVDYTNFKILGRTRDDAAGEAFDKAARVLGLPYPGGVEIDKLSAKGNPEAVRLPKIDIEGAPYDFSFSGLKTAVINVVHNLEQKGETFNKADIAASFNKAVSDTLTGKFMQAVENRGYKKAAIAGGVSANSMLRKNLQEHCESLGVKLYMPLMKLCGDNACMVGCQGFYEYKAGNTADMSLNGYATMSIENVIY